MKQRFEVMLHRADRKPKRIRVLLNGLFLAVFLLSYMVIIQPYYESYCGISAADADEVIVFTDDNSYILHKDGQYSFFHNDMYITELPEEVLADAPYNELEIREG